jgi:quinol monooxygenase YgiN
MKEMKGLGRIKIHTGKLEEFKRIAARCLEIVRTQDTGTLQYELFWNEDQSECLVFERYRDSEAGLEHGKNVGEVMNALLAISDISGEVWGDPEPALRKMLESQGVKIYRPFLSLAGC